MSQICLSMTYRYILPGMQSSIINNVTFIFLFCLFTFRYLHCSCGFAILLTKVSTLVFAYDVFIFFQWVRREDKLGLVGAGLYLIGHHLNIGGFTHLLQMGRLEKWNTSILRTFGHLASFPATKNFLFLLYVILPFHVSWVDIAFELFRLLPYIHVTQYLPCRRQCVDPFSLVSMCAFSLHLQLSVIQLT